MFVLHFLSCILFDYLSLFIFYTCIRKSMFCSILF